MSDVRWLVLLCASRLGFADNRVVKDRQGGTGTFPQARNSIVDGAYSDWTPEIEHLPEHGRRGPGDHREVVLTGQHDVDRHAPHRRHVQSSTP